MTRLSLVGLNGFTGVQYKQWEITVTMAESLFNSSRCAEQNWVTSKPFPCQDPLPPPFSHAGGSIFCKCAPCRLDLNLCLVPLWKGCILQKTGHALWHLPGGLIFRHVVVYALTGLFSVISIKVIQEELTFWTEAIRLLARGWSWVSVVPIL